MQDLGVEQALRRIDRERGVPSRDALVTGSLEMAVHAWSPPIANADLARMRVAYGADCEDFMAKLADRLVLESAGREAEADVHVRLALCYADAYRAAVWTSAHAEYLSALDAGIFHPPPPCIRSLPCASSGIDLSGFFAYRIAPTEACKAALPLVALLHRCTSPTHRGWADVVRSALEHDGCRSVVQHAVHVCLTGMHPQLRPSLRPGWQTRLRIMHCLHSRASSRAALLQSSVYIKEALRRCLASTMAACRGTHAALSAINHPVRRLHEPPAGLPHEDMEAAMAAFVRAGRHLALVDAEVGLATALEEAFERQSSSADCSSLAWHPSWLGAYDRQCLACNPHAHAADRPSAPRVAVQPLQARAPPTWGHCGRSSGSPATSGRRRSRCTLPHFGSLQMRTRHAFPGSIRCNTLQFTTSTPRRDWQTRSTRTPRSRCNVEHCAIRAATF